MQRIEFSPILQPLASEITCLLPPLERLNISHRDFKKFSTKQTNSRPSIITSIAGPRMVLFIFARVMTQELFGLRISVTSPKFKEEDKARFPYNPIHLLCIQLFV